MKTIFNFLFILIIVLFVAPTPITTTIYADTAEFAQIKNSNTYLYKSAESNYSQTKICLLENSYFVKIISNYNNDFYKVEYNQIFGYVQKQDVVLVNETPIDPYPSNITFDIGVASCYLRSSPNVNTIAVNHLNIIPANTKNLNFIGRTIGEEAMDFGGTIWYLTQFEDQIGYVYAGYTNSLSPIYLNTEAVTIFSGNNLNNLNPLTNLQCVLIIIFTIVPTFVVLYLLYKPKKSQKLAANKTNLAESANTNPFN